MVPMNASVRSRGVGVGVGRSAPAAMPTHVSQVVVTVAFGGRILLFSPLMTLAVPDTHLGPPLSKAFRKPEKLASQ